MQCVLFGMEEEAIELQHECLECSASSSAPPVSAPETSAIPVAPVASLGPALLSVPGIDCVVMQEDGEEENAEEDEEEYLAEDIAEEEEIEEDTSSGSSNYGAAEFGYGDAAGFLSRCGVLFSLEARADWRKYWLYTPGFRQ